VRVKFQIYTKLRKKSKLYLILNLFQKYTLIAIGNGSQGLAAIHKNGQPLVVVDNVSQDLCKDNSKIGGGGGRFNKS
jgi:hypothetical protein